MQSRLGLGLVVWVVGFMVSTASAQTPPASTQDADDERARAHFTAGRSYFDDGNYEQAQGEFQHAYDLSHRDALLPNIANCQERLGRWRDAADTLDRYVASLAADAPEHATMQRRSEALRQRADDHDAEEAARAEALRAEGAQAAPSGPEASTPVARPASDGLLVPAIVSFAVGGVAAIGWGVLGGMALSEQSRVAGVCGNVHFCTPDDVRGMDDFALGADIAMSFAIVGIALGVVLLIVDPPHGASEGAQARWTGTSLEGSF